MTSGTLTGPRALTRVVLIGLGKLGLDVAGGLLRRSDVEIVAAVDIDPEKVGRDVGELAGGAPIGVPVSERLDSELEGDVAVMMTLSRMATAEDEIAGLLARGISVLTSAEELAYPWGEFPEASARLDEAARRGQAAVLGTGANPGFLMDVVPAILSLATQRVEHVAIDRTMDLRPHRPARLTRFALGESPDAFDRTSPSVAHGHIGFRQSIDALARVLAVELDRVDHEPLRPAVLAERPRRGDHVTIEPGAVAVVRQGAVGYVDGTAMFSLTEHFGFVDPDDEIPQGDSYRLSGTDQSFDVKITPGVLSFVTTPAVLVNMVVPLAQAPSGLRNMTEFAVASLGSKGAWTVGA